MSIEELIHIPATDSTSLALWKVYSEHNGTDKHIFLTHGTFSDRRVCMGISSYLVEQGFTCWIMEWRSHGNSSPSKSKFNFTSIAKEDFPAVFKYLKHQLNINQLGCITHSGGGICLSVFLIENPAYQDFVSSISFFGCQAFSAAYNAKNYLKILIGKWLGALMGYIPAQKFGKAHGETYYTMKQWYNWNLSGRFLDDEGKDYEALLSQIKVPVLSICGTGDTLVAPPLGCQKYLDAFQNPQNRLLLCGKSEGFSEDYSHSRILHSRSAREEIWPVVMDWISNYNEVV